MGMFDMTSIKNKLLDLQIVEDNEWLDKYAELLSKPTIYGLTENHHIVPQIYFKKLKLDVDNSDSNLVKLSPVEHILAHWYLANCAKGIIKKSMWACTHLMINTRNIPLIELEEYLKLNSTSINDIKRKYRESGIHKGYKPTEKAKLNMSLAKQGSKNNRYGVILSDEIKSKISNSERGKIVSIETRIKLSTQNKQRRHFTNGVICKFTFECPEGFWPGRIMKKKEIIK